VKESPMISILLATYNGEKYIEAQLDSLFKQSIQEFILYINDDQSTDATWDIINNYKNRFPDRIKISQSKFNSGSAKFNFMNMMTKIRDDYVMLCDQDDVWLPNKIEKSMNKILELESCYGKGVPLLIHTDLTVVDSDLNIISKSLRKMMNLNYNRNKMCHLLVQNIITGCTIIYNRSLANVVNAMPSSFIMHDGWIALIASAFGKIDHLNEQTILYRQHEKSELGAVDANNIKYILSKFSNLSKIKRKEFKKATYNQAESFLNAYNNMLSPNQKKLLNSYKNIPHLKKVMRCFTIYKLGTIKNGFFGKFIDMIYI
jgi:glycosyltransferase involved in cell wall biosynthesis